MEALPSSTRSATSVSQAIVKSERIDDQNSPFALLNVSLLRILNKRDQIRSESTSAGHNDQTHTTICVSLIGSCGAHFCRRSLLKFFQGIYLFSDKSSLAEIFGLIPPSI